MQQLSSTCLVTLNEKKVRFERSVPYYVPSELKDGRSGIVRMRPLSDLTRVHAVFGGPMTHPMNRYGMRVRKTIPRVGTICRGEVSCDLNGCINARILNNDSSRAIAVAKKLYHDVY